MMIAPWPTLQSWAMWLMAMMRQPSPTSVQPSARVARWIVTYSRSTVPAPILTPDGVPSLNFKSWGRPPSTEPWPIFTPRPSSTRPSSTQWWPTSTSAPIVASADPGRPRDSHLGHDDRVLTDLDVVADLHQVVDLGPAADDRLPERGAVDRRVRPDFDVVLDQHRAHLRDLPVRFAVEGVAEAVGANHCARATHDALAERDPRAQRHARGHDRRLAHLRARPDEGQRADPGVRADHGARLDHRECPDRGGRGD